MRVQRAEARFDGVAGCLRTPAGGSSRQLLLFVEGQHTRSRLLTPREAARLIKAALEALPEGNLAVGIRELPEGEGAFGVVEGWRGPIWHWVVAGKNNTLRRVKVKDPSFANWPALNYAILKNIVPDFPLVNKSFNLSYAGNDL